jgi:hypothetical protein
MRNNRKMIMNENNVILNENTDGANAPNIATTDENLSIESMFQEAGHPSLGKSIFSTADISGPTAALFNVKLKADKSGVELIRGEVEVFPSTSIKSGLTQEALQDIINQFGVKSARSIIGGMLRTLTNAQENTKTLEFLEAKSVNKTTLAFAGIDDAKVLLNMLTKRVADSIFEINSENLLSFDSYCVLPHNVASSITLSNLGGGDLSKLISSKDLFIGKIGFTSYYLSPDPLATKIYVGIKDEDLSKSAAVFSEYCANISIGTDVDTGNDSYFIFNRYAITESPLSALSKKMMHKFTVAL